MPPGVDGWGYSLKGMMSMVVIGGFLITLTYWALQRTVVPRVQAGQPKKKKQKSNMSVGESFNFLAKSPYIRDLATLVSAVDDSLLCLCVSNASSQCLLTVLSARHMFCKSSRHMFGEIAMLSVCISCSKCEVSPSTHGWY